MGEWNASVYHRVSDPQLRWGLSVLDRLPLEGHELVLDVGCGTGRLTGALLGRLPRGCVVAVDLSANMLAVARDYLGDRFGPRIRFVRADATALPLAGADAIFSTASFHWILDHPRLFRSLHAALKPGGCLVAQCGGGPNVRRVRERANALMLDAEFQPFFVDWREPWEFADAETTATRLRQAGFTDVRTSVVWSPALMPDAAAYKEFVASVVLRQHLDRLPGEGQRGRFMDALARQAAADDPPFELDYWRLNMDARRP